MEKGSIKKIIFLVLNWFFGVVCLIIGLASFANSILAGLAFTAMSLLLIPPVKDFISSKIKKEISTKTKAISISVLLVIALIGAAQGEEQIAKKQAIKDFNNNKSKIFSDIRAKIDAKQYKEAQDIISTNLAIVENEETLLALQKEAITGELLAELESITSNDYAANLRIYQKLNELYPDNNTYATKLKYFTQKNEEEQEKQRLLAERKEKIEKQFSVWDGSHIIFTRIIKENMNNPKSYEHVKTVYWEYKDYIVVQTTFRGTNAFGGVVTNTLKAKFSIDGDFLGIIK